ncbi:hypothetical protein ES703_35182 [subsurface metagenome]
MYVCTGTESWTGHPGPYSEAYAEFPEGYAGPITVTHPNGQSKIIIVDAICAPEGSGLGPSDQEVEAAVIAALSELGTLPALVDWKKYLPWGIAGVFALVLIISLARK